VVPTAGPLVHEAHEAAVPDEREEVMFQRSRSRLKPSVNPLIEVVQPFDHRTRQALYAATNNGRLRRRTWNGCALNRAGSELGSAVTSQPEAADLFHAPRHLVSRFIHVWDHLSGSDEQCTNLLRDAVLAVGLLPEAEPVAEPAETIDASLLHV
jgi:hypothetical protein